MPILPPRKVVTQLFRVVACIEKDGYFLVKQGEKGKVMADLFEFPYVDCDEEFILREVQHQLEKRLGLKLVLLNPLKEVNHTFTRYKARLYPFEFNIGVKSDVDGYIWVKGDQLHQFPFSSGHQRILNQVVKK